MVLAFESNCKPDKHLGGRVSRLTDDLGAEFAAHSDSLAYRTIGIYVFLRTVMCSPVRPSQIAHALKLPLIRDMDSKDFAELASSIKEANHDAR